jgi:hypothetical protein
MRKARVLGRAFNLNLIACALHVARAEGPCEAWVNGKEGYLVVRGDRWRVVVMRLNTPDDAPCAVFELGGAA